MSEYIAKAPIEPRDYRVVFLIQKTGTINIVPATVSVILTRKLPYKVGNIFPSER